ncbi:MAG: D-alanyl-D-alanine carboxypeptidase [Desulfobacteraceae bacterium]|nr:D-alanyl-D-alanine carboxypeptidase [Desulfobacteraceae bacterium]
MICTNNKLVHAFVIVIIISVSAFLTPAEAENNNIGYLLTDKYGNILLAENDNKPLIPASILKIVTSLAAISCLGEDFRYQTFFYYNKQSSNLHVKGFGDPLFISEEIKKVCKLLSLRLKKEKIETINSIILDHSFFEDCIDIPGRGDTLNPYDASQGALCANFNTIFFKTDNTNRYISAEKQTPLLPIFTKKIIATNLREGRITLSEEESMTYPGQLIKHFLKEDGIKVAGKISSGKLPEKIDSKGQLFYIYNSDIDLKEIIQKLLKYSNNFIANQVLLTLGAHISSPPSNLEKSVAAVNSFLSDNFQEDFNRKKIKYAEGSGISRENRLACKSMIKVLIKFMPYHGLLRNNDNGFYKTGTLSGIRTRAGYIKGDHELLYPYVIMINQKNKDYKNILEKMERKVKSL